MKAKFTFLAALFLLTTGIYALEPSYNKSSKLTGSFLENRTERTAGITKHNPFQRNIALRKQADHLKSAQAVKQRLDVIVSEEWDNSTSQWKSGEKLEFFYDAIGNLTQLIEYEIGTNSNKLFASYKTEMIYDARGNMTQEIEYYLNETSQLLVPEYKSIATYDDKGTNTQSAYYIWDDSTNKWSIEYRAEYTYDAKGKLTRTVYSSEFNVENKTEYNYDANGNQTQITQYAWDNTLNKWTIQNVEKSKGFTFDANGRTIRIDEYHNLGTLENPNYEIPWKYEYTYSANGDLSQELTTEWDNISNSWSPRSKSEYTYNTSVSFSELIAVPASWIWEYGDKINYFNHQLTSELYFRWDINTNKWNPEYRTQFNYSPINVTSVTQLNSELTKIYPNPFSESLSFSIPNSYSQITFELFDLLGRKLLSKAISSNEKVNMEGLKSGMYLYKLNVYGNMQSGKLVKE